MVEVIMPPTIGAAIGFITSEPIPDDQRIGNKTGKHCRRQSSTWDAAVALRLR
jgi:hypothetical protein